MTPENNTGIRLEKQHVHQLMNQVRGFGNPVVSLYATVHPGRPETSPQAVNVRAKNTIRDLDGVGSDVRDRIAEYFAKRPVNGRSVAVFANAEHLEALELDVPLLVDPLSDQLDARIGEPYFTPLLSALSENAPSLVVFADRDRVCVYRVFLGQVESVLHATREPTAKELDEMDQSKEHFPQAVAAVPAPRARSPHTVSNQQNGPKYLADRGDAAKQLFTEGIKSSQAAFYRENAERIRGLLQQHEIDRVLVMGPERDRHLMQSCLPVQVAKCVVGLLPSSDGQLPPPHRVLELVQQKLAEQESEKDAQLLDVIAERGVKGVAACLAALQEGRLRQLVVPVAFDQTAYRDPQTDYVAAKQRDADALSDQPVEKVDLSVKLPELVEKWGATIEFVTGEQETRIQEEFGGMGGLARW